MTIVSQALTVLLAGVVVLEVLLVLYLLFLTVLAISSRGSSTKSQRTASRRRYAILVPAHNEEAMIGRLIASLNCLDYPSDLVDVCVVADNCEDNTASVARSMGAQVYERYSAAERAKGFALRWLIEQLQRQQRVYDAFLVIDADSIVAPNFLSSMEARLNSGAQVVQAYYSVLNPRDSAVAALRYAALAAVHYLRPLGRSRIGLSTGLKGNGMCFAAPVMERFAWRWFTLAEDVEFHLALVAEGLRVDFAPETWVKGDMPVTLRQAATQNARWERGRILMARSQAPRLLWQGVLRRSWLQIDAAIEQLIPPLSVPFAVGAIAIPAAWLLDDARLGLAATACLVGYLLYLLSALVLVRAPLRIYCALGMAPVYIAWKLSLYAQSLVSRRTMAWVRTARTPTATAG